MFRQVATEAALGMHGLNDRIVDAVRRDDLDAGDGNCSFRFREGAPSHGRPLVV
jgi:hypothetical protein